VTTGIESAEPLLIESDDSLLGAMAGAVFSADRTYRYVLTRTWDATLPVMTLIGLNPSKANAFRSDPTARRFMGFARREGCGGYAAVNVFALAATDPRDLTASADPVGPANDQFIEMHTKGAHLVVAAWGAGGALNGRGREVGERLTEAGVPLKCLGVTSAGHPRHPLYVKSDAPLVPWQVPS